ncbi:MAG: alpha/beta hydrolase [Solirubrobacteraceae bacterium]
MLGKGRDQARVGSSAPRIKPGVWRPARRVLRAGPLSPSGRSNVENQPMLTPRAREWMQAGRTLEFRGRSLFTREQPGVGPTLVFMHGFPSSSFDWRGVLELLPGRRALLVDFLGFGLSDKPREHLYSLAWLADAIQELVLRCGSPSVFLVAHDMGTSVATELMARDMRGELGIELAGALLFNGSILLDQASPTLGQRVLRSTAGPLFARLNNERAFRAQFSRVFSSAHPLTRADAADHWALLAHHGGHRLAHLTIHYMDERERLTDRWHGAFRDWPGDLSLAWGLQDPVATTAVLDGLRELRPGVAVRELPELGHYPQIEDPSAIAAAVLKAVARAVPE